MVVRKHTFPIGLLVYVHLPWTTCDKWCEYCKKRTYRDLACLGSVGVMYTRLVQIVVKDTTLPRIGRQSY